VIEHKEIEKKKNAMRNARRSQRRDISKQKSRRSMRKEGIVENEKGGFEKPLALGQRTNFQKRGVGEQGRKSSPGLKIPNVLLQRNASRIA